MEPNEESIVMDRLLVNSDSPVLLRGFKAEHEKEADTNAKTAKSNVGDFEPSFIQVVYGLEQ